MSQAYRALVDKVDGFAAAVFERRRADFACRAGCSGCCEAWLTVSPVEAQALRAELGRLDPETRRAVAEQGHHELARERRGEAPRCAMLDPDGRCTVYAARPLVCRSQGLPLSYPNGVIPAAAVRARSSRGEITVCPLNFTERDPAGPDVLDAQRLNELLAVVNLAYAREHGMDPQERVALSELAVEESGLSRA